MSTTELLLSASTNSDSDPGLTWKLNSYFEFGRRATYIPSMGTYVIGGKSSGANNGYISTSTDAVNWTPVFFPVMSANDVFWTGSLLVVVGDSGAIRTSANLINWSAPSSGTGSTLWRGIWTGSLIVVVGGGGIILTSPDGVTWTTRSTGTTNEFVGVTTNGSLLVAVGAGGVIRTSTDGITWTARASGVTSNLYDVVWNGSVFIISGFNSSNTLVSTDGINWTYAFKNINSIIYASNLNLYVAVGDSGNIITSTNLTDWSVRTSGTTNTLNSIVSTGSLLVTVGATGTVLTSTDAITWTSISNGGNANTLNKVIWTGSTLVAVGGGGWIRTSTDGSTWATRTSNTSESVYSIALGAGKLVAIAGTLDTVLSSSDEGTTWTTITNLSNASLTSANRSIAYGNGKFVVKSPGGGLATSTDGTTWSILGLVQSDQYTTSRTYYPDINQYIASVSFPTGTGALLSSTDGITYTVKSTTTVRLNNVLWNGAQYLAVGESGNIVTSPDGITWTSRTSGTTNTLSSIAWSGTQYVVTGSTGTILTSPDGITWTSRTSGTTNSLTVAYGNSIFVATRPGQVASSNHVLTSTDGITWIFRSVSLSSTIGYIKYINSIFILGFSNSGNIFTSTDGINWTIVSTGNIYTDISYGNGVYVGCRSQYYLDISTNLTAWTNVISNLTYVARHPLWDGIKWVAYDQYGGGIGSSYTSTNNTTWTQVTRGNIFYDLFWDDSKWWGVADRNSLYSSTDNITWTLVGETYGAAGATSVQALTSICRGNLSSTYVTVGNGVKINASYNSGTTWEAVSDSFGAGVFIRAAVNQSGKIFLGQGGDITPPHILSSSNNGITWKPFYGTFDTPGNGVLDWTNDRLIASGGNTVLGSTDDGATGQVLLSSESFTSIAYSSTLSLYIITSSSGIFSSTNKVNLTQVLSGINFNSVVWTGSIFVASTTTGGIYTSTNGTTWTLRTTGTTVSLGLYFGGGLLFAFGASGTILTSTDGITWVPRTTGVGFTINSIGYNGTLFKAVGDTEGELTSTDGITWSINYLGTTVLDTLYINSLTMHISVGQGGMIRTSTDGTTWTFRNSGVSVNLSGVTYGGGLFVVVGKNGTILTSSDAISWTPRTSGTTGSLISIAYSPTLGVYVACGADFNSISSTYTLQLHSSTDAVTWTPRDTSPSSSATSFTKVIWGNNEFIACGSAGQVLRSSDGSTWTRISTSTGNIIYDIAWNGSMYAGVAGSVVTRSSDGVTWNGLLLPIEDGVYPDLRRVINVGNLFVAVGSRQNTMGVYKSTDAVTWTKGVNPGPNISYGTYLDMTIPAISWTGTTYYLSGQSGWLYQSNNAVNWSMIREGLYLGQILFVPWLNLFIMLITSAVGKYKTSTDGYTWTTRTYPSSYFGGSRINSICDTGSCIVGVGQYHTVYSPNGIDWTPTIKQVVNPPLNAVIADTPNSVVAVGNARQIAVSPGV